MLFYYATYPAAMNTATLGYLKVLMSKTNNIMLAWQNSLGHDRTKFLRV